MNLNEFVEILQELDKIGRTHSSIRHLRWRTLIRQQLSGARGSLRRPPRGRRDMTEPMRIVLVGAVESTRVALKALRESACDVAMVVTLHTETEARGKGNHRKHT